MTGGVIAVELVATLVTAARLWLAAKALGLSIGGGSFVLGVAPVLSAMVFVVPAGLRIREGHRRARRRRQSDSVQPKAS